MNIIEFPFAKKILIKEPRSKKRRIIKKWNKNPRNYRTVPDLGTLYKTNCGIICHPIVAEKLRQLGLADSLNRTFSFEIMPMPEPQFKPASFLRPVLKDPFIIIDGPIA